ncbi:lysoplasmalogenase [Arcticibacterium luteifluviistationis]|uniref:Lysoplasmalogenase n=1 Tax=Arcticibacterium luteifluviistationis TaxID=1784714 RepID=A0A2Z4GGX7_9BACT|nr:lysoplasmalogenase [Arcticibacterium luteifluviistationis]AWW00497.1 lysoplasmalogenase [Arcticibacterium luteifluviistationis]
MKLTVLYFALLALNIIGGLFGIQELALVTKPLLMPVLIGLVWLEGSRYSFKWALILALVLSWAGDLFLMFERESFFVFGLGSFLLAHLVYIFIYRKSVKASLLKALPFIGFVGLFCFGVLWNKLSEEMTIPVYIYMLVISTMAYLASCREVNVKSFESVLVGAILFVISDAFIAVNEFVQPVLWPTFWVMSTYGLAQYLIVKGLLKPDLSFGS